jgi:hypothetical protein
LFSLCLGLGSFQQHGVLSRLQHDGVLVEVKVVARRQDGGSKKEPTVYIVSYRFKAGRDPGDEEVTVEKDVGDYHQWLKTHEGDRVTVRFGHSDPNLWDLPDRTTAAENLGLVRGSFEVSIVAGTAFFLGGLGRLPQQGQ